MAKNAISAEQLEVILGTVLSKTLPDMLDKILGKFETQIDRLIAKVEARFDDKIEKVRGELFVANSRIDALEDKLIQQAAGPVQPVSPNVARSQ